MNTLFEIAEKQGRRIINLAFVCSAERTSNDSSVSVRVNFTNSAPQIFYGDAADTVWRILSDSSLLVYDYQLSSTHKPGGNT